MSKLIAWIPVSVRLPEMFAQVPTLLFSGSLVMNSVQLRNVQQADGRITSVRQWATKNEQVTFWLDGVPEPPTQRSPDEGRVQPM